MKVGNEPPQYNNRGQNPQQTQQGGYHNAPQGYQQGSQGYQQPMQNRMQNTQGFQQESPAMVLTRRIKSEQGSMYAGYFLNAIRPYIAPAEILMKERTLNIQAQPDPRYYAQPEHNQQKGSDMSSMLPLLMSKMNKGSGEGGSGIDPMTLMKMMGKKD